MNNLKDKIAFEELVERNCTRCSSKFKINIYSKLTRCPECESDLKEIMTIKARIKQRKIKNSYQLGFKLPCEDKKR
jgi:Zn finger protein HypA/HybF involved in hydrogenase expression